jgi:protein TonB
MFNLITRSTLAVGFTLSVFLLMSYLVKPGDLQTVPEGTETQINIIRKERDENSEQLKRELPKPPQAPNSPPPLVAMAAPSAALQNAGFAVLNPLQGSTSGVDLTFNGDRRAIPMVAITPEYPPRQLQNGVEGWVLLEFTIAADGSVENIVVVESEPENAFDREAIRAMRRWSYQPKMVNGRPVPQHHMQEIFRFEIVE